MAGLPAGADTVGDGGNPGLPICAELAGATEPPPGGTIFDDGRWRVTHHPTPHVRMLLRRARILLNPTRAERVAAATLIREVWDSSRGS